MKALLLVFAVVSFSFSTFSQKLNKVISITPTYLTGGAFAIQPGYQFRINQKFSLLSEVAIPISKNVTSRLEGFRTFRASTELKYYRKKVMEGRFVGMQLGYTYRKFIDPDSGGYLRKPFSDIGTGYSKAVIKSPVFFFNLKLGREITHWKKLYLDYFLSFGIRFIPTRFEPEGEYNYKNNNLRGSCTPFQFHPAWENNWNHVRPGAGAGVRLGLKL